MYDKNMPGQRGYESRRNRKRNQTHCKLQPWGSRYWLRVRRTAVKIFTNISNTLLVIIIQIYQIQGIVATKAESGKPRAWMVWSSFIWLYDILQVIPLSFYLCCDICVYCDMYDAYWYLYRLYIFGLYFLGVLVCNLSGFWIVKIGVLAYVSGFWNSTHSFTQCCCDC